MSNRIYPALVNKTLKKEGLNVEIWRSTLGYYAFFDLDDNRIGYIESIHQHNLDGWTLDEMVRYVRTGLEKKQ